MTSAIEVDHNLAIVGMVTLVAMVCATVQPLLAISFVPLIYALWSFWSNTRVYIEAINARTMKEYIDNKSKTVCVMSPATFARLTAEKALGTQNNKEDTQGTEGTNNDAQYTEEKSNEINNAEDAQGTKDNNNEIINAEDDKGTTDKKSDDNRSAATTPHGDGGF